MAKGKIAPGLVYAMERGWCHEADPEALTAELKALLSVVRAGDRFFWHAVQSELCCIDDSCGWGARFRRALARLDRVSGGKP